MNAIRQIRQSFLLYGTVDTTRDQSRIRQTFKLDEANLITLVPLMYQQHKATPIGNYVSGPPPAFFFGECEISGRNTWVRPLQINSLFPVHRPHLVTVSHKYSIIPYPSIISGYSCILTGSVKAISKQGQLTCQQCYQVGTNFTFVLFLQLKMEGTSLNMPLCSFLWLSQENNGLKSCQSCNEIMEMDRPHACKYA